MPNIKSAKKRVLVIEKKTMRNKAIKSALKTQVKKFLAAYVGKNCAAEEITRGKNKVLTYLEFDN